MRQKEAYIQKIAYYLPEKVLTNDELAAISSNWTAEKIYQKTGISSRPVAGEDETALDLAEKACRKLLDDESDLVDKIDFLILMTQSPDYKLPPSACILQNRLGLRKSVGAFDINLGCSAYIYGLAVAKSLIVAGVANNVLLVTSETYTKYINPKDLSTRTLFGDAASATVISDIGKLRIGEFELGTDGTGADWLIVPAGMAKLPSSATTRQEQQDENGYWRSQDNIYMDGAAIFSFSISVVPKAVKQLLAKTRQGIDDIGLFVFHQANAYMLNYLRKKLRIPEKRFYINLEHLGNTVSASVPIALAQAWQTGAAPEKGKVMLVGFGVGLSWGAVLLDIGEADR